jgi:hypothetical protein
MDKELSEETLEDIKDLYVEGSFNSRWIEIETNHKIGLILNDLEPSEKQLYEIAKYLKKPVDFLVDCQLFEEEHPNLDETNYDKTISWSKIQKEIRKLRPVKKAKEKLTVAKVKDIVRGRKKLNEERQQGMLAFEDNEILKALDDYGPVEEAIKTEGEGE